MDVDYRDNIIRFPGSPRSAVYARTEESAPDYTVADLGTLGGTFAEATGVNNRGWVEGFSTLPGDMQGHAFLWRNGVMTDLGTIGGPNSFAGFPLNERGEVPGDAETSTPDPFAEDFCAFHTNFVCLAFLWQNGVMTPLPTLGGNNGAANEINNRSQVVGVAENNTPDPTCVLRCVLQLPRLPLAKRHDDRAQQPCSSAQCPLSRKRK